MNDFLHLFLVFLLTTLNTHFIVYDNLVHQFDLNGQNMHWIIKSWQ